MSTFENIAWPRVIGLRWESSSADDEVQLGILSAEERIRYDAMRHPRSRRHFLLGRIALRTLLAHRLGMGLADVPLVQAADGGVDVVGSSLKVSIAHAGGCAVAAAGPMAVGVDLEPIRTRSAALESFMLHPSERAEYHTLPLSTVDRRILYWTLKEAVLKALRTGFRRSPKHIRLVLNVGEGNGLALLDDRTPLAVSFGERNGFCVALAYER